VIRAGAGLALAGALVLGGCGGEARMPASAPSTLAGKPLPKISRPTLEGSRFDTSELAGRVVVVKFFADYCAPCKKTLPAAEALHREHPEVTFVGISEDEDPSTAAEISRRYQLSFPIIHDRGQALAGKFRVAELPATFVAGRDGTIRWVGGASQDEGDLGSAVESVSR
jgi:thiol-disulfide isomerase/thioredoxin